MSELGDGNEGGSWMTVGARPRRRAVLPSAPGGSSTPHATDRRERRNNSTAARSNPDWQLVMRSRQAITKLRDQDFALTRLGQINHAEVRAAKAESARKQEWREKTMQAGQVAGRSRLGAKFPASAVTPDRSRRPPTIAKKHINPVLPRFDVPLNSDVDFPSLSGDMEVSGNCSAPAERRRASVALKLDQSLRSMAQQSRASAGAAPPVSAVVTVEALPPAMPTPPRAAPYSDAVSRSRSVKILRKSERRDLVREDIREDVAILQSSVVAGATQPSSPSQSPSAVGIPINAEAGTSTPTAQRSKEKEKRAMKKAKKKESQLIQARLNASKDTHVQLVTAHEFRRLHGSHAGRRRAPAEAVDLRAPDQYPSLQESLPSRPAGGDGSKDASHRHQLKAKSYSRMLRELPKNLPNTDQTNIPECAPTEDTGDAKKKAPKKKAPMELSLMDLAEMKAAVRRKRREFARVSDSDGCQPAVRPATQRRAAQRVTTVGGNQLDSTPVVRHRGKTRPDGKKKKLSLLKRVILRERAERRKRRAQSATAGDSGMVQESGADGAAVAGDVSGAAESTDTCEQASHPTDQVPESSVSGSGSGNAPVPVEVPADTGETGPCTGATGHAEDVIRQHTRPSVAGNGNVDAGGASEHVQFGSPRGHANADAVDSSEDPSGDASAVSGSTNTDTNSSIEDSTAVVDGSGENTTATAVGASDEHTAATVVGSGENTTTAVGGFAGDTSVDVSGSGVGVTCCPGPSQTDQTAITDEDDPPSRGPAYTPTLSVDPKLLLHSRQFREYCQQTLSADIDETARLLLQDLTRFQDRLYNRDPIKARSRRRLVIGLREVSKQLAIKPLQCVILAPNIEKIESAGGLDQAVQTLLSRASERAVPLVCALKRRALGHACKKPVPVSCVGIYNYQGSEDNFKRLMQLTEAAQDQYRQRLRTVERALAPEPVRSAAGQLLSVFDRISGTDPAAPTGDEDPTVSLLAKLRAVTLSATPEVNG